MSTTEPSSRYEPTEAEQNAAMREAIAGAGLLVVSRREVGWLVFVCLAFGFLLGRWIP